MSFEGARDTGWNGNNFQELKKEAREKLDLGTKYGDKRLNCRVEDISTGQVHPLFEANLQQGSHHFSCKACGVSIVGKSNLDTHVGGKKHTANMSNFKIVDSSQPVPPGEDAPVPSEAAIKKLLADFEAAPLVGMEYLVEVLSPDRDPFYKCELCNTILDAGSVISDIVSVAHRLKYLKRFYPIASKKFDQVPNTQVWESSTFDCLESVIQRIESQNGRLSPCVVGSEEDYRKKRDDILNNIEAGPHFRQKSDQDFSSLPDPFGSYRHRINPREIHPFNTISFVADSNHHIQIGSDLGLGHIEDPQMQSLMHREIAR